MAKWKKGFDPEVVLDGVIEWIVEDGQQSEASSTYAGAFYRSGSLNL